MKYNIYLVLDLICITCHIIFRSKTSDLRHMNTETAELSIIKIKTKL